jgi:uncharacterized RDD family membrane protein YckC
MECHIARNGQQLGIFAEQAIQTGLGSGQFMPDDLLWTEGMAEWQPLSSRFAVSSAVSASSSSSGIFNPYAAPSANVQSPMNANVLVADLGKRLGAFMIDFLIGSLPTGFAYFVMTMSMTAANEGKTGQPEFTMTTIVALCVMVVGLLTLLVINIVMLTTRGQTPGKRCLGIRIVSYPDNQKPGFVKAFLLRGFVNGLIGVIPCLGFIYAIVDICFIFQADHRCIHDLIAGTHVIEGNPPAA